MGWSIRRRKGLLGGLVNLNFSKSGLGVSVGVKGARVGVNAKGQTYSQISIPGTGIYNRSYHGNIADHVPAASEPKKVSGFCTTCGKPLPIGNASFLCSLHGGSPPPAGTIAKRAARGKNIAIALGAAFVVILMIKSCGGTPAQTETSAPDDATLMVSTCGPPDVDNSTANDNPRPPIPIRILEYKSLNIRFTFMPSGDTSVGAPPPYRWTYLAVQDTVTNQPLDVQIASKRMPCWFKR